MYIIAGLGNPGRKYEKTRHNAGFIVADELARRLNASPFKESSDYEGLIAEARIGGEKILIVKPLTFMNESGHCVAPICRYYDIPHENLILIHDDIEFDFGLIKIRAKGGPGTHNGMKSVIAELGYSDFARLRFGIGPEPEDIELYEYVLSNFNFEQYDKISALSALACDIIIKIINDGVDSAMNKYNPKRPKPQKNKDEDAGKEGENS